MGPPASHGIARAPWYSGAIREPARLRLRGSHPLRPAFPGGSTSVRVAHSPGIRRVPRMVLQPPDRIGPPPTERSGFGLVRVRSPLLTESLRFLFLRVLRCFSSPGSLHAPYGFGCGSPGIIPGGLPHSDIRGSKPAGGSPRLFAAIHVLHRHSVPRHPPCALLSSAPRSTGPPRRQDHVRCSPDARVVAYTTTRSARRLYA